MNALLKKAEEIGSKVFGVGNPQPSPEKESPPLSSGIAEVELHYEHTKHRLHMDLGATAAAFCTQVYLATGVVPARQKIVGFKTSTGQAMSTPLLPDADLRKLGVRRGMKLMLFQLPVGHELEPYNLTTHPVDKIASKCMLLQQRTDAIEAIMLVQQQWSQPTAGDISMVAKLHKLCTIYDDMGLKLLLKVDEIDGDENTKAARKALVRRVNGELDRLDRLKKRLDPLMSTSDSASAALPSPGASPSSSPYAAAA
eukprot:CAMPEP_0113706040 /NCGR_PEP_ID=MMETSP0038_2-20120614/27488_1 /TAXON_ID=2898 /ORGANISM="Cryptomonas paramecium" /LENGTH=254 /DNA_ID=CAMNT_0000631157 /DNA_START=23 /DNA_END=783 /DNA_ORIENTATION=- /assembly_acc=CAM_ASM_000170